MQIAEMWSNGLSQFIFMFNMGSPVFLKKKKKQGYIFKFHEQRPALTPQITVTMTQCLCKGHRLRCC